MKYRIEPAPECGSRTRWSTFFKAHWESIAATDFFSVEVCTLRGFVTYYVLFFVDLATRSVHIAGVTPNPDEYWMMQTARNLTDHCDGFLCGKSHLLLDRDTKYTHDFCSALAREGVGAVHLPPRSPNLNAYAERFVRSVKEECLSRMVFLSEAQLRYAIGQYMAHYHGERNHQGVDNQLLRPVTRHGGPAASIRSRRRLGGLLNFYHAAAA